MGVMEVTTNIHKKRKLKPSADENDLCEAPVKVFKIHKAKKSTVRTPHDSDAAVNSDLNSDRKKSKPVQKIVKRDEIKRKPKIVRVFIL